MVLNYKKFIEAISGTELIGRMGPSYGDTDLKNKTISKKHTKVFDIDGEFISWDDYQEYINIFLKNGGNINELTGNVENDMYYMKNKVEENE
jgi:hypothetical protein